MSDTTEEQQRRINDILCDGRLGLRERIVAMRGYLRAEGILDPAEVNAPARSATTSGAAANPPAAAPASPREQNLLDRLNRRLKGGPGGGT